MKKTAPTLLTQTVSVVLALVLGAALAAWASPPATDPLAQLVAGEEGQAPALTPVEGQAPAPLFASTYVCSYQIPDECGSTATCAVVCQEGQSCDCPVFYIFNPEGNACVGGVYPGSCF